MPPVTPICARSSLALSIASFCLKTAVAIKLNALTIPPITIPNGPNALPAFHAASPAESNALLYLSIPPPTVNNALVNLPNPSRAWSYDFLRRFIAFSSSLAAFASASAAAVASFCAFKKSSTTFLPSFCTPVKPFDSAIYSLIAAVIKTIAGTMELTVSVIFCICSFNCL